MATVSLDGVRKSFADREVVHGVSCEIGDGELVVVVGPSGCGKSTLLRMIAGLETVSGGTIAIDGVPITGPRRDIGLVFQSPVLLPWRTILKNILVPAEVLKLDRTASLRRAHDLLNLVGLDGFADR